LLLGLWIEHTGVVLVHLLLHLARLVIIWHLLLLGLTVQNLHALILGHPALVAILSEGEVVVEATLAGPVADVSLLVSSSLSLGLSVIESVVVFLELYDSVTSGDSDKLVTFLNDFIHFVCSFDFHCLSLFLGDISVFFSSFLVAFVAGVSSFAVEVCAS